MITISYSETTGFEPYNRDKKSSPMIIGMVYEDESDQMERARITAYFQTICQAYGVGFPSALCSASNMQEEWKVKWVQTNIIQTFPEFIQYGTYEGKALLDQNHHPFPERTGQYQIIVLAKRWLRENPGDRLRVLIDDSPEENPDDNPDRKLYEDMAKRFIDRAVFSNLHYLNQYNLKVSFDVPTRVVPDPPSEEQRDILGHQGFTYSSSQRNWSIVDAGSVRAWVEGYNRRNADEEKIIPTTVEDGSSVFTEPKNRGYFNAIRANEFAFVFLTDALCKYLLDGLDEKTWANLSMERTKIVNEIAEEIWEKCDDWMRSHPNYVYPRRIPCSREIKFINKGIEEDLYKNVRKIIPYTEQEYDEEYGKVLWEKLLKISSGRKSLRQGMLCYFDAVDDCYNNAVLAMDRRDVFEALSQIYDGQQMKGDIPQYYKENLFPELERQLTVCANADDLKRAHNAGLVNQMSGNLPQEKMRYIFQKLNEMANKLGKEGGEC